MEWQWPLALMAILTASLYLARLVWKGVRAAKGSCGGCGSGCAKSDLIDERQLTQRIGK